ncbi:MAG: glutaminase domain-containing protein [Phycisphaeraceae bacterium JB051]
MQLMSWSIARLGSRFGLLFEPHHKRVRHSALGRFLDAPLDLAVGLEGPDGKVRVLPFTQEGESFHTVEQFERANSITFRAFSSDYQLRFEFNIHSTFYPQDESLCLLPAIYLEMRINPSKPIRWVKPKFPTPKKVKLFLKLKRPDTDIQVFCPNESDGLGGRIDLEYDVDLTPSNDHLPVDEKLAAASRKVHASERIISLNPGATPTSDGNGLQIELPVSEEGSGIKWRLVWGAFCGDPILNIKQGKEVERAKFRYASIWPSLDDVMYAAIKGRDERLVLSRNFEKLLEQAPLRAAQRHLLNQSFQQYLSNTFWCELPDRTDWFSVWEGSCFFHSTLDVEYNLTPMYLSLWPSLLAMQFDQWATRGEAHEPSNGIYLAHDLGVGFDATQMGYDHHMPVEENCNFLLMMQAYAHWTGDLIPIRKHEDLLLKLADYLLWTDIDDSGFPSKGVANTIDDATAAQQYSRKQTYLAIKRLAALAAVSDMLMQINKTELGQMYQDIVDRFAPIVEKASWRGDHFAVCVDRSTVGVRDAWTNRPLTDDEIDGADAYSIYSSNGLLLPMMCGQPWLISQSKIRRDLVSAVRETLGHYGCGHNDQEPENVWVSQNLWRDHMMRYLGASGPNRAQGYWDMQIMSNTFGQSYGFVDTYVTNNLSFYPRGATTFGYLLSYPRLTIDRLAPGGARISVDPDHGYAQRWPLLPLADWKAGKIPVCVVDCGGDEEVCRVVIETQLESVIIRGQDEGKTGMIG